MQGPNVASPCVDSGLRPPLASASVTLQTDPVTVGRMDCEEAKHSTGSTDGVSPV
jgi:hypothetical protein